ncbi:MAG: hypothetical protein GKR93_15895 [Gammaproteobacteria bacterium]|nr:hypothetical protein [Gammaproteobacteria bacterium]
MHTLLKSQACDPLANQVFAEPQSSSIQMKKGLSPHLRKKLLYMHISSFDWQHGGLKTPIKFLDRDSIEFSLCQSASHDKNEERMARLSLNRGMELLDLKDGGIYQFATQNGWSDCHYSKTIAAQAGSLRLYSLAFALFREHDYLKTTRHICDFLRSRSLTEEGCFRSMSGANIIELENSQIRSRDNGWVCEALASCYEFTSELSALEMAKVAMNWLERNRRNDTGGFNSFNKPTANRQMSDTLAVARAALQLYRVTAEHRYLSLAEESADYIVGNFHHELGGFESGISTSAQNRDTRQIDENICLSRFLNLLHHYTERQDYLTMARHGLSYLATPAIATSRIEEAGILLLDEELNSSPVKITILANCGDRKARKLADNALRCFGWYKVIHQQSH